MDVTCIVTWKNHQEKKKEFEVESMYRVECIDIDGEAKVMRGFETSEEAHEWLEHIMLIGGKIL